MKRTKERIVLELNNSINEIDIHSNKVIDLKKELIQFAKFKVGQKVLVSEEKTIKGVKTTIKTEAFVSSVQVGGYWSSDPKEDFFYTLKKSKKDGTQSQHGFSYYPIHGNKIEPYEED